MGLSEQGSAAEGFHSEYNLRDVPAIRDALIRGALSADDVAEMAIDQIYNHVLTRNAVVRLFNQIDDQATTDLWFDLEEVGEYTEGPVPDEFSRPSRAA